MESTTSSSESLQSHGPHLQSGDRDPLQPHAQDTVPSNRPDLRYKAFQELDLHKVDEFKNALRPNSIFGGCGDEQKIFETIDLISFDTVEIVGEYFDRGPRSRIYRVKVDGQWFAFKKAWLTGKYDRQF